MARGGGLDQAAREIVALFFREERPRMASLPGLAAERRGLELANAVHNIAGGCAILGARQAQAAAVRLEVAARKEAWGEVPALLATVQAAWGRLEAALAGYGL